jgi:hypothetical protein
MAVDTNVTKQSGSDAITTISLAIAASATGLAAAQAVAAAGNLVLNGASVGTVTAGVYSGSPYTAGNQTFYSARRMNIVSANAGDTTQTATFTGTDRYNNPLTETVSLNGNTTVTTVNDFATVTSIAISAATAGNISAGTSATASGAWIIIDRVANNPINIQVIAKLVTGAATFSVEETFDDPNAISGLGTTLIGVPFPPETVNGIQVSTNVPPIAQADATLAAKNTTTQTTISVPFWAYRLTVTAGTGVVQMQGLAAMKPWHH